MDLDEPQYHSVENKHLPLRQIEGQQEIDAGYDRGINADVEGE